MEGPDTVNKENGGDRIPLKEWEAYYEHTKEEPPRPLLVEALQYVTARERALDLGACALNDSIHLLNEGFSHVTALDYVAVAASRAAALPPDRFQYAIQSFEEFEFLPETYDLVNAQFSLLFIDPSKFQSVFESIIASLKPGGVFTGQIFGEHHAVSGRQKVSLVRSEDIPYLLRDVDVISLPDAEDRDKIDSLGHASHVHVHHIIARKK